MEQGLIPSKSPNKQYTTHDFIPPTPSSQSNIKFWTSISQASINKPSIKGQTKNQQTNKKLTVPLSCLRGAEHRYGRLGKGENTAAFPVAGRRCIKMAAIEAEAAAAISYLEENPNNASAEMRYPNKMGKRKWLSIWRLLRLWCGWKSFSCTCTEIFGNKKFRLSTMDSRSMHRWDADTWKIGASWLANSLSWKSRGVFFFRGKLQL